jgi:uncharacterized protein (DUF1330 family)
MAGQGTNILALDYNNIQSKINQVLGSGSSNYGYNQTVLSSQVSVNQKITALQWQNLYNDLIKARTHQTGLDETSNLTYPTTSTQIKESDRSAYQTYVNTIDTNRLITPPAGQATLETYSTSTRTSAWNGTITNTVTITFSSADNARAYFNAGGYMLLSASLTPDSSTTKNNSWQTMLTNMGSIKMTYNATTNSGSNTGVTTSSIGYLNLTTSQQRIFQKLTETPTYSPNQYDIYANINGGGDAITFSIQFADLSSQPNAPWGTDENVTGTLVSTVQGYRPSGTAVSIPSPSTNSSGP